MAAEGVMCIVTVPSAEVEAKMAADSAGEDEDVEGRSCRRMEEVLKNLLDKPEIQGSAWHTCHRENYKQVSFSVVHGKKWEKILKQLSRSGIGSKYGSTMSVIPCSVFCDRVEHLYSQKQQFNAEDMKLTIPAWGGSFTSLQPESSVIGAIEGVTAQAEFSFDFLILLLIAGFVAALGLMENSIMILIASMLISPLMGPVLSCAVGAMTRDIQLVKMGILNEIFGLMFCIIEGFFCGLIIGLSTEHFGTGEWPTEEMISRGELPSVWMGMIIAILSGIAVAISELGQKTSSLVGVAISASLLPPAVNTGLLWALTCTYCIYGKSPVLKKPLKYSDDAVTELAILGSVSLCLTLINIIFIFVFAAIVLKLKIRLSLKPADDKYINRNLSLAYNIKRNVSSLESLHSFEKRFPSNVSLAKTLPEELKSASNQNGLLAIKSKGKCLHFTGIAKLLTSSTENQTPKIQKSFENLTNSEHHIPFNDQQCISVSEKEPTSGNENHLTVADEDMTASSPDIETRPHSVTSSIS
ncbi:uncharacterized protein LOC126475493 [Schistocerca serialis cubense]|uniref:uncharacterized protein LOC126475493 n=1 Tax=Schistocerca serialis cubense TaxID=2023355 RepID=UPI00214ED59E|nr:uncharacterized protein LOC126475493 [Schistocerca serialis cubense]